jgi:hypothetical protein
MPSAIGGGHVKLRKKIATTVAAALFYSAPSFIPLRGTDAPVRVAGILPTCGVTIVWRTADTAEAFPAPVTPFPVVHGPTPWGVIGLGAAALSVIINGIVVSQTQCRELTQQEALTSIFLPFIGMAFNKHHSACH